MFICWCAGERREWEAWKAEIQPFVSSLAFRDDMIDLVSMASDPLPPDPPSKPWNSLEEFMKHDYKYFDDDALPMLYLNNIKKIECKPVVYLKSATETEINKVRGDSVCSWRF